MRIVVLILYRHFVYCTLYGCLARSDRFGDRIFLSDFEASLTNLNMAEAINDNPNIVYGVNWGNIRGKFC